MMQAASYSADAFDVENIRTTLRNAADRKGEAPLDSPVSGYAYEGECEGILLK
jgi:hypothetical protein